MTVEACRAACKNLIYLWRAEMHFEQLEHIAQCSFCDGGRYLRCLTANGDRRGRRQ
jgi:hypothetical protein